MLILGTVPFPLEGVSFGEVHLKEDKLYLADKPLEICMGTTTLITSCLFTLTYFKRSSLKALLVSDYGEGIGSKRLFSWLKKGLVNNYKVICGHYIMPYVDEFKDVFPKLKSSAEILICDAGMMYAAKASALAKEINVFTPDAGEMAFLADKDVTHPAYVKKIFFEMDTKDVDFLIKKAWEENNLSKLALIKGKEDLVVKEGKVIDRILHPTVKAMEAIGGTGDSVVGILVGLVGAGFSLERSLRLSAQINRTAGKLAKPTPATRIYDIIKFIPKAMEEVMKNEVDTI